MASRLSRIALLGGESTRPDARRHGSVTSRGGN